MAKFFVDSSFVSEVQQSFNMLGRVADGEVRSGMIAQVSFNSSFSIAEVIDRIEYARRSDGSELTCLCFDCDSKDELDLWRDLNIGDEIIEVVKAE